MTQSFFRHVNARSSIAPAGEFGRSYSVFGRNNKLTIEKRVDYGEKILPLCFLSVCVEAV
jgi:hypothetical protein